MTSLFQKNRALALLVLVTIGMGILAIAFNNGQTPKEYETIKARALEKVLKDDEGDPMISKDTVRQYLLFKSDDYQISYQKAYDLFLISINAPPFNDVREKAEQQFLALLEGNAKAACFFHVEISTPSFANPEFAGQQFPLSFCEP